MQKFFLTLAAVGGLATPTLAQLKQGASQPTEKLDPAALAKIRDEGLNRSQVMATVFCLTDVCGPRLAGSEGLARANAWTRQRLTDYGLINANIEAWGDFGRGWDIDKSYVAMTAPYYHALIGVPKAWTPGTAGSLRKQVAYVNVKTAADLAKYKGQLRDKIVVLPVATLPTPNFEPDARRLSAEDLQKMADAPAGGAPTAANRPAEANPEARRAALLAARELRQQLGDLLLAEGAAAVLSPGRGTDGTVFTTNGAPYAADAKPVLPELEMSSQDQLRLIRLVEAGIPVEVEPDDHQRGMLAVLALGLQSPSYLVTPCNQ